MSAEPSSAKRLFNKANKAGIPLSGTFELTPLCNLNCKMCYVRKNRSEVDAAGGLICADEWYRLAKEAKGAGMLFLLLTGGEPLTYPSFFDLFFKLKGLGLMVALNTNGILLDEEKVKLLASDAPYRIQMTLYGASNETYEELCGIKNGFDRIINTIELLKKYGIVFKLNASMTPWNIKDIEKSMK